MGNHGGETQRAHDNVVIEGIYKELTELSEKDSLTPDAVVATAKSPKSAMHGRIWSESDKEAANKRRIYLARQLIEEFTIVVRVKTERYEVAEFVRDPSKPVHEQGYVPIKRLQQDKDLAYRFMNAELTMAQAYVKRARDMAVVLGLVDEFDMLDEQLQKLRTKTAA